MSKLDSVLVSASFALLFNADEMIRIINQRLSNAEVNDDIDSLMDRDEYQKVFDENFEDLLSFGFSEEQTTNAIHVHNKRGVYVKWRFNNCDEFYGKMRPNRYANMQFCKKLEEDELPF